MNCERIQDILSAYLENDLAADKRGLLEEHLETCPDCSALLDILRETREALRGFPEHEVSPTLLVRLQSIPEKAEKSRFNLAAFLKPALQPLFAATTAFLLLFSIYSFHPDKKLIDKTISRSIHRGYNTVEKLYAKAGSVADELSAYKDTFLSSFKNLKIFGGQKD